MWLGHWLHTCLFHCHLGSIHCHERWPYDHQVSQVSFPWVLLYPSTHDSTKVFTTLFTFKHVLIIYVCTNLFYIVALYRPIYPSGTYDRQPELNTKHTHSHRMPLSKWDVIRLLFLRDWNRPSTPCMVQILQLLLSSGKNW